MAANTVDRSRSWQDLTDECCLNTRGVPNTPYNNYVSFPELESGMDAWNLNFELTYDYGTAAAAPWSIVLCAGTGLRYANGQAPYPASWFGNAPPTEANHFVCWLPAYEGSSFWVMNPLDPSDSVARYDPGSWQSSFAAAYILHGLPTPEQATPPAPEQPDQLAPARFRCIRPEGFHLKPQPAHGGEDRIFVPYGEEGDDSGARFNDQSTPPDPNLRWGWLQYKDQYGYAPSNQRYFERLD